MDIAIIYVSKIWGKCTEDSKVLKNAAYNFDDVI